VHDTCTETNEHLQQVREVGDALGIGFLGLGASPQWSRAETPVMPKGRYGIMAPYMDKVGSMGRDMMFRTCTVQVNLDFASEADMVKKLRVSVALQPIATALFANSPFLDGKLNGYKSYRSHVWTDTDNARAGMLPFAFEDGMSYERYADYALDVPMYFVMRNGGFINTAGESFRTFLDGKLPQLPGEKPTVKDWADHLTTIFPEVRLKRYLEMRGADSGPWRRLCALPAFWVGLLYAQSSLDTAWDFVKHWNTDERQSLRNQVPRLGLDAKIGATSVADIAKQILQMSRTGLDARDVVGCKGKRESSFLDILDETVSSGKTAADQLIDLYKSAWSGDMSRVFRDFAY
jgi:glutamate--cysteine ligase